MGRAGVSGGRALVSGGSGGIGRAIAERLLADGASVMVADLKRTDPVSVAAELDCEGVALDVTDPAAWTAAVSACESRLGGLSILVNAAGILPTGSVLETDLTTWRLTRAVNLDGVFHGCRAAFEPLCRSDGGAAIVNLSSLSGIRADPRTVAYDATKAAVLGLTREIAVYCGLHDYAIRCNAVLPGSVDTGMMGRLAAERPKLHDDWTEGMPMGRQGMPTEIAGLVSFLASDEARFITGAEYVIDGAASA